MNDKSVGLLKQKGTFMRKLISAFLVMVGLPVAALAQSAPIKLYYAQSGWAVASSSVFGSNGLPLAYNAAFDSATSSAANYVITVEGSSNTFGSLTYTPGTTQQWTEATGPIDWTTANISFTSGSYSENVVEDSSALACLRNGASAEYDVLLGPNSFDLGTNVVSAINPTYRMNPALVPALTKFASLLISGRIILNNVSQPITPATCADSHASMGFNLSFVDRVTNQNFSYSLHLAALCLPGADYISCTHQPQNAANWYKAGNVTAVTDTPTGLTAGLAIVPSGGAPIDLPLSGAGMVTFTSLNLLPRIDTLLQNNPSGLDTNIADWQFSGLTYGTNIWGDSSLNATWQSLSAAVTCFNASCD